MRYEAFVDLTLLVTVTRATSVPFGVKLLSSAITDKAALRGQAGQPDRISCRQDLRRQLRSRRPAAAAESGEG